MAIEQAGAPERGEDLRRELEMHVALAPAPEDADGLDGPLRERAYSEHAGRGGAHLRDPGRVHDSDWAAGGSVGEHEQPVDVGDAERLVARVASHPLQPDRVRIGEVGGHRVDEGVLAGVNADLRRHLHITGPLGAEGALEDVDDLQRGQADSLDVCAAEIADRRGGHRSAERSPRERCRSPLLQSRARS